jgi:universal stress protein A
VITLKAILCPVDISEISRGALGYAIALAAEYSARLRVLEVVSHPSLPPALAPPAVAGLRETTQVEEIVAVGKPSREILRAAGEMGADLIVLGVHGRGPLERAMLGSTTHQVIRHAACPVLTVRVRT